MAVTEDDPETTADIECNCLTVEANIVERWCCLLHYYFQTAFSLRSVKIVLFHRDFEEEGFILG